MSTEQPRLWALDLDQTMLDTNAIFNETADLSREMGITGGEDLHSARKSLEATGGSFDTDGFLKAAGASDEERSILWDKIGCNQDSKDYLYSDTVEFLNTLEELEEPYLTVTYGSLRTQLPKLRATRLDQKPYLITDIKKKGELIGKWQNSGDYAVTAANGEVMIGRTVQLVDDKASSFTGIPEDSAGFLVQRTEPKPSQMGETPERIIKVKDLATITRMLRTKAL